jgi:virginiamycin B lyase
MRTYNVPSPLAATIDLDPGNDDHTIWFAEIASNAVAYVDTRTGAITEVHLPIPAVPIAMSAGPDDAMYFTDELGKLGRVDAKSHAVSELPFPVPVSGPLDITCTKAASRSPQQYDPCLSNGSVWVAEGVANKIVEFRP